MTKSELSKKILQEGMIYNEINSNIFIEVYPYYNMNQEYPEKIRIDGGQT